MYNSLRPHGLQHARLLCPSLFPGVCSSSCSLSWGCYLTFSSSASSFSLPSIFPSIRIFSSEPPLHIRWPNYWIFSISPLNVHSDFISLRTDGLISLQSKRLSITFSSTTIQKHQFSSAQPSLWSISHICT